MVAAARVTPEGATKKNVEKHKAAQEEAGGAGTLKSSLIRIVWGELQ